mmetsp:Transcript_2900/g.8235  ORF Transcript_2900/g.8235 Transcript_2900/m.8235 type:complete len:268 (+) Transcript_2900:612-1415(+)
MTMSITRKVWPSSGSASSGTEAGASSSSQTSSSCVSCDACWFALARALRRMRSTNSALSGGITRQTTRHCSKHPFKRGSVTSSVPRNSAADSDAVASMSATNCAESSPKMIRQRTPPSWADNASSMISRACPMERRSSRRATAAAVRPLRNGGLPPGATGREAGLKNIAFRRQNRRSIARHATRRAPTSGSPWQPSSAHATSAGDTTRVSERQCTLLAASMSSIATLPMPPAPALSGRESAATGAIPLHAWVEKGVRGHETRTCLLP